jgi:SAM-dependent methyltransferase
VAPSQEYKQLVKDSILDKAAFVRAVLSGQQHGHVVPWRRVVLRPVLIKGERHIQVSHFDERRDITKNYAGRAVVDKLDELLAMPFKSFHIETTERDIQVQFTKKGKVLIHQHQASGRGGAPPLQHDRQKDLLLPVGEPDPFLETIGIMTREGKVRARMRAKFRQINEFLKLVLETGVAELPRSSAGSRDDEPVETGFSDAEGTPGLRPLSIVDCGCGNAYLSFAVYHYLNHILHVPTHLVGIDVNRQLIQRRAEQARALGWQDLAFQTTRIEAYEPGLSPDVVLALHACDTATDEALAQAVKWQSRMVFAVPCCHHDVQQQLGRQPPIMRPVYRHGILKERLGDVLTDAFRAVVLRLVGYEADVIQFVSAEHTDKNLMIRAHRAGTPGARGILAEYQALKGFFQVTPYLEHLLAQEPSFLNFFGNEDASPGEGESRRTNSIGKGAKP